MDVQTVLRRSNLADGNGKGKVYATLARYSTITTQEVINYLLKNSQVGAGEVRRVIEGLLEQFMVFLPNGHAIKIDGLGTFSLRMRSDVEQNEEGKYVLKNARVDKVNFVPDRRLVMELNKINFLPPMADLTNVRHLTDEEAEALALDLLGESGFFMIEDFMYSARVSYSTAYRHLKKMVECGVLYRGGGRGRAIYTRP